LAKTWKTNPFNASFNTFVLDLLIHLEHVIDTIWYMVQTWVFHDGFLPRDSFGYIEVLMDDGFSPNLLVGNLVKSRQAMHGMFLGNKESLFGVYFESHLVPINEYEFRPHGGPKLT
jgi:hypothetical protein